jgi:hypothetical protein
MITSRWLVTAAHCFQGKTYDTKNTYLNVAGKRVVASNIQRYANWSVPYPDIALVKLSKDVAGVSTLPLGTGSDLDYFLNKTVTVFGYGRTTVDGSGDMTSTINKSPDGAWWRTDCPSQFSSRAKCFDHGNNNDGLVRTGDSGGPWVGWRDGGWRILAIVSAYAADISNYKGLMQVGTTPATPDIAKWISKTTA